MFQVLFLSLDSTQSVFPVHSLPLHLAESALGVQFLTLGVIDEYVIQNFEKLTPPFLT
jgi:hypothetical protein